VHVFIIFFTKKMMMMMMMTVPKQEVNGNPVGK